MNNYTGEPYPRGIASLIPGLFTATAPRLEKMNNYTGEPYPRGIASLIPGLFTATAPRLENYLRNLD